VRKVLIVSPHFPPTNAADMHRVRILLPFLGENGWAAEVLAVAPESVAAPRDEWMADGLPEDVPVHRVRGLGLGWSKIPGLGTLGWRALPAVGRKGGELLASGRFDFVYFSTTQWPVHLAGPRWQRKFGVPFAIDYQDPWVNDYYREHPEVVPPGGRWKYDLSSRLSRWMEPRVLSACAGYTAVSEAYPRQLAKRYPWAGGIRHLVLPFPGSVRDYERARQSGLAQNIFDAQDGRQHWVYVGRGGKDMARAARVLFRAVQDHAARTPGFADSLRMHFIGTSYASAGTGRPSIAPLAEEYGLKSIVEERTDRISYADNLRCLTDASALIALCSDDRAYTASKIYPYLLARKPLMVVCHQESGVADLLRRCGGGVCATFGGTQDDEAAAGTIRDSWFEGGRCRTAVPLDAAAFASCLEGENARQLTSWWNQMLG
jgi:hypothetical protein